MEIRRAEEKDIHEIAIVEEMCFDVPWSEQSLREDIMNDKSFYLVAENEEDDGDGNIFKVIVGYVGIWQILDEGHINNVAVLPTYRRKHIAENLLNTMMELTMYSGVKSWTLEVRAGNEPAKALYGKLGFRPLGIRKEYYEDNHEDAIIMWAGKHEE